MDTPSPCDEGSKFEVAIRGKDAAASTQHMFVSDQAYMPSFQLVFELLKKRWIELDQSHRHIPERHTIRRLIDTRLHLDRLWRRQRHLRSIYRIQPPFAIASHLASHQPPLGPVRNFRDLSLLGGAETGTRERKPGRDSY